MKIVFGTTNQRKIENLKKLIKILDLDLEVLGLDDIDWNLGEINEDDHTIQSLIFGPLYLIVMGIPSTLWGFLPYFQNKS